MHPWNYRIERCENYYDWFCWISSSSPILSYFSKHLHVNNLLPLKTLCTTELIKLSRIREEQDCDNRPNIMKTWKIWDLCYKMLYLAPIELISSQLTWSCCNHYTSYINPHSTCFSRYSIVCINIELITCLWI